VLFAIVLFLMTKMTDASSTNLNIKDGIPQRTDPKRWSAVSQNAVSLRSRGISALEIAAEQVRIILAVINRWLCRLNPPHPESTTSEHCALFL